MQIPQLQIRQTPALIGIESTHGQIRQSQPRATMEMQSQRPELHIQQPWGDLQIDSSKAWDALAVGGHLRMLSSIYSVSRSIALEGIARIAQDGDRMGRIYSREKNVIGEIARDRFFISYNQYQFAGEAKYDNVEVYYTAHAPRFDAENGQVHYHTSANNPELEFIRGNVNIYMQQYPKVEIIPPQIDQHI